MIRILTADRIALKTSLFDRLAYIYMAQGIFYDCNYQKEIRATRIKQVLLNIAILYQATGCIYIFIFQPIMRKKGNQEIGGEEMKGRE